MDRMEDHADPIVGVRFVVTEFPRGGGVDPSAQVVLTTTMKRSETGDPTFLLGVTWPFVAASKEIQELLSSKHYLVADVRGPRGVIIETIILFRP